MSLSTFYDAIMATGRRPVDNDMFTCHQCGNYFSLDEAEESGNVRRYQDETGHYIEVDCTNPDCDAVNVNEASKWVEAARKGR